MDANEKWRWDQERRDAWRQALEGDRVAFEEALQHLERACRALDRSISGEPIYERVREAVHQAKVRAELDAVIITKPPTDTYIGNKAAFGFPRGW